MRPNRVDVGLFGSSQIHCEHWNVVFRDEWSLMSHPGTVSGPPTPRRSVELCCGETDARASAPSCFTIKPSRRMITSGFGGSYRPYPLPNSLRCRSRQVTERIWLATLRLVCHRIPCCATFCSVNGPLPPTAIGAASALNSHRFGSNC